MVSVNLPWELVEEILYRVPPQSLARFRTVCKQWNSLFDDNKFVNDHLVRSRPQFMFRTDSKMYSIAVNFSGPWIEVHELILDIPGLNCEMPIWLYNYVDCDGLLFCTSYKFKGVLIWNPWLKQTRLFASNHHYPTKYVIGYDNKKRYKVLDYEFEPSSKLTIYEIGLYSKKVKDLESDSSWSVVQSNSVSLNGTLYWAGVDVNNGIFIRSFSFSTERLTTFCRLPLKYNEDNILALAVFRKDRLSLLNLCNKTSKIKIWLTKNNINDREVGLEEDVVWIKLMTVLIPDFPKLPFRWYNRPDLTYFLDNDDANRLVICCYDETQQVYIYIVRRNIVKKIKIDLFEDLLDQSSPHLRTYIPSLVRPTQVKEDNNKLYVL
ncbi:F-box domain [Arabidopsis suecica]|uniref:F-box domain n=1 Tax=Arabidopsis suecica TaxID=45249 RepID=A0A8T2HA06_ARASU|nr:F-box domain [Arabidopsis suecica]